MTHGMPYCRFESRCLSDNETIFRKQRAVHRKQKNTYQGRDLASIDSTKYTSCCEVNVLYNILSRILD